MKLPVYLYEMKAETKFTLFTKYLICDDNDDDICECNDEDTANKIVNSLNTGIPTAIKPKG
jgi:hypothetical protein